MSPDTYFNLLNSLIGWIVPAYKCAGWRRHKHAIVICYGSPL